jgi:uncharacterized protein DUF4232
MVALAVVLTALAFPAAPPARCTTAQLRVTIGPGQGAAGTAFFPLRFTNVSGRPCTLRGFPGVSSVTRRGGRRIGDPAARESGQTIHTVTLHAHGGRATATYAHVNVDNFSRAACRPRTARGLRVFPPNTRRAAFVAFRHRACSRTGLHDSRVRPVAG